AEARLLRSRAEDVAAAETKARVSGRSLPGRACRSARRGAVGRGQGRGAVRRPGDGAARAKAAHGRRRRKRRALPAALDCDRSRDRGIRETPGARLRVAVGRSAEAGGGAMSTPRHFLDISELPLQELRNMLALSVDMKAKLK